MGTHYYNPRTHFTAKKGQGHYKGKGSINLALRFRSSDGFYPHGKPAKYAYTEQFIKVGNDINRMSEANTRYPGINVEEGRQNILQEALENLRSLIDGARQAELKFLADTGMDIYSMNGKDIFKAINLIFNSKDTIDRGLQYMKQLASPDKNSPYSQTYRDVSKYFSSYLNKAIEEEMKGITGKKIALMTPDEVKEYVNQIISRALLLSYKRVEDFIKKDGERRGKFGTNAKYDKDVEQAIQAVSDMTEVIKELRKTGAFKEFGNLFNLSQDTLKEWRTTKQQTGKSIFARRKGSKYNNAKVASDYDANALEVITSTAAALLGNINAHSMGGLLDLTIVGQHTGQWNNMKADTLLFVAKADVNTADYINEEEYKKNIDSSIKGVRAQNIDAIDKYFDVLKDNVSHIIAISDKNYSISANFKERGIEAQKSNLANIGGMLSKFGVGQTQELINYLANCGAGMVQGEVNSSIRTMLQTQIAYYLFDKIEVKVSGPKSSVNVVNLINVGNIYIPLSVYLEGLYESLVRARNEVLGTPSQFVSVSISLGGPTGGRIWTEDTWARFRQQHEEKSFIEYKFLKNLAEFISGLAT